MYTINFTWVMILHPSSKPINPMLDLVLQLCTNAIQHPLDISMQSSVHSIHLLTTMMLLFCVQLRQTLNVATIAPNTCFWNLVTMFMNQLLLLGMPWTRRTFSDKRQEVVKPGDEAWGNSTSQPHAYPTIVNRPSPTTKSQPPRHWCQ